MESGVNGKPGANLTAAAVSGAKTASNITSDNGKVLSAIQGLAASIAAGYSNRNRDTSYTST